MEKPIIKSHTPSVALLVANIAIALIYFSWWFAPGHMGNPILFSLLFIGEVYHVGMALAFWFTVWPTRRISGVETQEGRFAPSVDVFIPVAGEPVEIVRKTAVACQNLDYPNFKVYILNDGFVAKKENWRDIVSLAEELGVGCITRAVPGGAKAGNVNNALRHTTGAIVVLFDADMAPYPDFLTKVIPYFQDQKMGFVQTPQYYHNAGVNHVTGGAWEQQELFFGPIMDGKGRGNSAFICGTNVAIRRKALLEVGGMCENNIAEDFITSLSLHQKGWKSHYIKEVFAEGLAPHNLHSYCTQQLRWARGSLEVLFHANPLLKKELSFTQRMQYLTSALYYCNGVVVLIDILMPLIFLFGGVQPVAATTTSFALFFIPFIFASLYTLSLASGGSVTLRAIAFSQSSFMLHLLALFSVLTKHKMAFVITPKQAFSQTSSLHLVSPHLSYILLACIGAVVGIHREGMNPSVLTNITWVMFNSILFLPFIRASFGATAS